VPLIPSWHDATLCSCCFDKVGVSLDETVEETDLNDLLDIFGSTASAVSRPIMFYYRLHTTSEDVDIVRGCPLSYTYSSAALHNHYLT